MSGNITIEKEKGRDYFFFPLNIGNNGILVGGTTLMPYHFMRLTMDQPLSGDLDFLLIAIEKEEKTT